MKTITFSVPNISCKHCVHAIKMELIEVEGVSNVDADVQTRLVTINFDDPATEQILKDTLAEINYPVAE